MSLSAFTDGTEMFAPLAVFARPTMKPFLSAIIGKAESTKAHTLDAFVPSRANQGLQRQDRTR
jgi:hypothetical protein